MAVLRAEADAPRFAAALESITPLTMSAGTLQELGIAVLHKRGPKRLPELFDLIEAIGIDIAPVSEQSARDAIDAYSRFGKGTRHPAQLNFGDCFAYALAKALDEPLLYKGDDFARTDIRSAL